MQTPYQVEVIIMEGKREKVHIVNRKYYPRQLPPTKHDQVLNCDSYHPSRNRIVEILRWLVKNYPSRPYKPSSTAVHSTSIRHHKANAISRLVD